MANKKMDGFSFAGKKRNFGATSLVLGTLALFAIICIAGSFHSQSLLLEPSSTPLIDMQ
jgi:hypothetical protein